MFRIATILFLTFLYQVARTQVTLANADVQTPLVICQDEHNSNDCRDIVGSTGPNEKSALPKGYGEEHFIDANTDITYLIRFQNTGTDTAFNIKVRDTLSQRLDLNSLRPGGYSHDYELDLFGEHVVQFSFPNILLPDSSVNEPASHGFISFTVSQKPDLPVGTVIRNSAAIYFDFSEPVITNEVFHTIGEDYIPPTATGTVLQQGIGFDIFPNPMGRSATLELYGVEFQKGQLQLFDNNGRHLRNIFFNRSSFKIMRGELVAGNYFFTLILDEKAAATGTLVIGQ